MAFDLHSFANALATFRTVDSTMTLLNVRTFIEVAREEGLTADEYASRLSMYKAIVARALREIGTQDTHAKFAWVEARETEGLIHYSLTKEGRDFLTQLSNA